MTKRKSVTLANPALPEGAILETVSLRMKHLNLVNFCFLGGEGFASAGNGWPVVVVLWKDDELRRLISVWEVAKLYKAADRDFVERVWANGEKAMIVDQGARILIPTCNGTVLCSFIKFGM